MKNKLTGKLFQVLEMVASSPEPLSIRKIAKEAAISSATLSRIISDLCEYGMIEKFGYHQVRPSLGMIRIGQDALTNFSLPRIVTPLLRSHAAAVEADGAFAGIHQLKVVHIFNTQRAGGAANLPYWEPLLRSRLAAVVLGVEYDDAVLEKRLRERFPAPGNDRDIDFFLSNCRTVRDNGYIAHREFGRGWSVNFPVPCNRRNYGVALFGKNAENCNLDRMIFETSRLASRLTTALDESRNRNSSQSDR